MQRVNPNDTTTFTDESDGSTFTCLRRVTDKQWKLYDEAKAADAGKKMKLFGIDVDQAMKEQAAKAEASKPEKDDSDEKKEAESEVDYDSIDVNLFRFRAIARSFSFMGDDGKPEVVSYGKDDSALVKAYETLDPASGKWVDDMVKSVWKNCEVTESEGKSQGGS